MFIPEQKDHFLVCKYLFLHPDFKFITLTVEVKQFGSISKPFFAGLPQDKTKLNEFEAIKTWCNCNKDML